MAYIDVQLESGEIGIVCVEIYDVKVWHVKSFLREILFNKWYNCSKISSFVPYLIPI